MQCPGPAVPPGPVPSLCRPFSDLPGLRALFVRRLRAGSGHQPDDRQFPVGLLLVLGEAGRGGGDLLPGCCALRPVELLGDHRHLPALDLDLDLAGMGGDVVVPRRVPAAPAADATISQLPSGPGNQPTGVVRSAPLLRPTVVRTRVLKPRNLAPPLRIRLAISLLPHRNTNPAGWRAPRVPAVVSKLMTLSLVVRQAWAVTGLFRNPNDSHTLSMAFFRAAGMLWLYPG